MDYVQAIQLLKLADILEMPPSHEVTSHFPLSNIQQLWKYKHKDGKLALKNGDAVYSFTFPEQLYPEVEGDNHSFHVKRLNDDSYHSIDAPERTAQVHRSHPGQLYVTLHEGKRNPTYTFKHEDEDKWKVILKKHLNKQLHALLGENLKEANLYNTGIGAFNSFTNLPPWVPAGATLGGSYLLNKLRGQPDPYDQAHPIIAKLMDYGIPLATIMGLYYGGKGMFNSTALAPYLKGALPPNGVTIPSSLSQLVGNIPTPQ